jgi:hypothetical protein
MTTETLKNEGEFVNGQEDTVRTLPVSRITDTND